MTDGWLSETHLPIATIVASLGWRSSRGHYPCPSACAPDLPVYSRDTKWRCMRCDSRGDACDYVSHALHGRRFRELGQEERATVKQWFAPAALRERPQAVATPEAPAATPAEVEAFWRRCLPIDREVGAYLRGRAIDPGVVRERDLARVVAPDDGAAFWPRGRTRTWRLVVPGYGPDGRIVNLHARATGPLPVMDGKPAPKTLWAKGIPSSGVLMWNGVPPGALVCVAEGIADYLTFAASDFQSPIAVYGATSGGFGALGKVGIRRGAIVVVAPDAGDVRVNGGLGAGDKYEQEIRRALVGREVVRVRLPAKVDVNDHVRGGGSVRGLIAEALSR